VETLIFLASVPVSLALVIYTSLAWRGIWRFLGFVPILALVAGCVHGLLQNSNLWPFWVTEYAPYGLGFGIGLWVLHFFVCRFIAHQSIRQSV
jgi:hypothetical protein